MTLIQVPVPLPISWNDTAAAISIAANTTASGSVTSPGGSASCIVQLSGVWVATVQIQISRDGVNYQNVVSGDIKNLATGDLVTAGNITATGIYQLNVAGIAAARVITTAYTSGTIVGELAITPAVGSSNVSVSGAVTISGTPSVTLSGTSPVMPIATSSTSGGGDIALWSTQFAGGGGAAVAQSMKSSSGRLYGIGGYNPNSAVVYLQYFFQALGSVTVGTTSPFAVFPLAPQAWTKALVEYPVVGFTAFTFAVTTGRSNGTAPTSAVDIVANYL